MCTLVGLTTDLSIASGRSGALWLMCWFYTATNLFCVQQCQLHCWQDDGDTERETARTWHHRGGGALCTNCWAVP